MIGMDRRICGLAQNTLFDPLNERRHLFLRQQLLTTFPGYCQREPDGVAWLLHKTKKLRSQQRRDRDQANEGYQHHGEK